MYFPLLTLQGINHIKWSVARNEAEFCSKVSPSAGLTKACGNTTASSSVDKYIFLTLSHCNARFKVIKTTPTGM